LLLRCGSFGVFFTGEALDADDEGAADVLSAAGDALAGASADSGRDGSSGRAGGSFASAVRFLIVLSGPHSAIPTRPAAATASVISKKKPTVLSVAYLEYTSPFLGGGG
jgi:hypothetical protein